MSFTSGSFLAWIKHQDPANLNNLKAIVIDEADNLFNKTE